MSRTLNLRHVQSLSPEDLQLYFGLYNEKSAGIIAGSVDEEKLHKDNIHSLWMGPNFGSNSSLSTLSRILEVIPLQLRQLDLDLTMVSMGINEGQSNDRNVQEEVFQGRDVDGMSHVMCRLLQRLVHLQSLSLRYEGSFAATSFSTALKSLDCAAPFSVLQVLDFRGNHMGISGVRALVDALVTSHSHENHATASSAMVRLPRLRHLILSWNSLTDDCVQILMEATILFHSLRCLDLSCNPELTDISLNQHLARALTPSTYHHSGGPHHNGLEKLVLFSCPKIQTISSGLVHILCHQNYTLQNINLQGTSCDLQTDDWQRIQFALLLNRCGRKAVLTMPMSLPKDQTPQGPKHHLTTDSCNNQPSNHPQTFVESYLYGRLCMTNGTNHPEFKTALHHSLPKTDPSRVIDHKELLMHIFHCYAQGDNDFSILYYFCRETIHQWCES